jgi:myxalamid-type polyketide synthase MxaB
MRGAGLGLADRLRQLPTGERPRALRAVLRDRISDALGIESSEVGARDRLMDLGVNSMKAVELKLAFEQELDMPLSTSLLFDCPTIESLAGFLLEQMTAGQGHAPGAVEREPAVPETGGAPGRFSSDVAERLAAELSDLQLRETCDEQ